jgi:hypothetical protein
MHQLSLNILQELLRTQHEGVQRELLLLGIRADTPLAFQTISWSRASCAPSVRQLIEAVVRLAALVLSGTRYQLREQGADAEVCFALPESTPLAARAAVEFVLAYTARWALASTPSEGAGIR